MLLNFCSKHEAKQQGEDVNHEANEIFKTPRHVVLFSTVMTEDTVVYLPPHEALTVSPSYIPLTVGYLYHVIRFLLTLCGDVL